MFLILYKSHLGVLQLDTSSVRSPTEHDSSTCQDLCNEQCPPLFCPARSGGNGEARAFYLLISMLPYLIAGAG
jgi:hypothetical protein